MLCCQVTTIVPELNLATPVGRVQAMCTLINCYRLLKAMSNQLPPLEPRIPLWQPELRGRIVVTLNLAGAHKRIADFKAFTEDAANSFKTLKNAYAAAAAAAAEQQQPPFLVRAVEGPANVRGEYSVQTTPLGYNCPPVTEEVSQCL